MILLWVFWQFFTGEFGNHGTNHGNSTYVWKKTIFSWGYNRPSGNSPIQADEPTPLSSTWWAAWHPKSLL
jgi:hypothetical protein